MSPHIFFILFSDVEPFTRHFYTGSWHGYVSHPSDLSSVFAEALQAPPSWAFPCLCSCLEYPRAMARPSLLLPRKTSSPNWNHFCLDIVGGNHSRNKFHLVPMRQIQNVVLGWRLGHPRLTQHLSISPVRIGKKLPRRWLLPAAWAAEVQSAFYPIFRLPQFFLSSAVGNAFAVLSAYPFSWLMFHLGSAWFANWREFLMGFIWIGDKACSILLQTHRLPGSRLSKSTTAAIYVFAFSKSGITISFTVSFYRWGYITF